MPDDSRTGSNLWIQLMWISIGFVSWYLSKFLFSYVLSPMLIDAARAANANSQSAFLMAVVNMLYANVAGFALCFIFAALLSYFTQSTKLRLLLFVVGAIAVNLYVRVEGLAGYMRMYPELPSWAITSKMQGLISLLLITPLCSFAGSKIGTWIKMKKKT
jgi:hypothetical protein